MSSNDRQWLLPRRRPAFYEHHRYPKNRSAEPAAGRPLTGVAACGEGLPMQTPDVVILVPGFLGFARFGGFYYFADRLVAVLRGLLEEPLGYPVPVVPVTTHPTAILPEARTLIDLLFLVPRDLAAAAGFEFAAPNDVIKFMWQIARNRDLIEDLKPERMEAVRARLSSDPETALTCFVTGTMPRDDATRPSDPFFRDMYRLTQGSESVSSVVQECDGLLRTLVQEQPDLVIRS